jgi:hypothetical protein
LLLLLFFFFLREEYFHTLMTPRFRASACARSACKPCHVTLTSFACSVSRVATSTGADSSAFVCREIRIFFPSMFSLFLLPFSLFSLLFVFSYCAWCC